MKLLEIFSKKESRKRAYSFTPIQEPAPVMSYTAALAEAYNIMPKTFYASSYIGAVRILSQTKAFDSTILRDLRQMRQDHPDKFLWRCVDTQHARYEKFEEIKFN